MLKSKDKEKVLEVIKKGNDARVIYRANALNLRGKRLTMIEVADFLEITSRTVFNIEKTMSLVALKRPYMMTLALEHL